MFNVYCDSHTIFLFNVSTFYVSPWLRLWIMNRSAGEVNCMYKTFLSNSFTPTASQPPPTPFSLPSSPMTVPTSHRKSFTLTNSTLFHLHTCMHAHIYMNTNNNLCPHFCCYYFPLHVHVLGALLCGLKCIHCLLHVSTGPQLVGFIPSVVEWIARFAVASIRIERVSW